MSPGLLRKMLSLGFFFKGMPLFIVSQALPGSLENHPVAALRDEELQSEGKEERCLQLHRNVENMP